MIKLLNVVFTDYRSFSSGTDRCSLLVPVLAEPGRSSQHSSLPGWRSSCARNIQKPTRSTLVVDHQPMSVDNGQLEAIFSPRCKRSELLKSLIY